MRTLFGTILAAVAAFAVCAAAAPGDAARMGAEMMNPGNGLGCLEREGSGELKVLIYGNSIALHAPKADIGWTNCWGMAASAASFVLWSAACRDLGVVRVTAALYLTPIAGVVFAAVFLGDLDGIELSYDDSSMCTVTGQKAGVYRLVLEVSDGERKVRSSPTTVEVFPLGMQIIFRRA